MAHAEMRRESYQDLTIALGIDRAAHKKSPLGECRSGDFFDRR
jgi:hypothetical protein